MKTLEEKLNDLFKTELPKRKEEDLNYIGYLSCSTDVYKVILDHNIETMQSTLDNSNTMKQTIIDICDPNVPAKDIVK